MNKFIAIIIFILSAITTKTYAVRPFITDDGVTSKRRTMQWESWGLFDKYSGQQWNQFSYGITDWFEVAFGGVWGYDRSEFGHAKFSFSMPMLETKFLLCEYEPRKQPGIALATGTSLPYGKREFVPPGYGAYSFLAATYVFNEDEKFTVHGNFGVNYLRVSNENQFIPYGGLATQIKLYKGLHVVGEVIAGDPYAPKTGIAYQAGFRYFISDVCQVDAEIGQGLAGKEKMPFWVGFGARFVFTKFENKTRIKNEI